MGKDVPEHKQRMIMKIQIGGDRASSEGMVHPIIPSNKKLPSAPVLVALRQAQLDSDDEDEKSKPANVEPAPSADSLPMPRAAKDTKADRDQPKLPEATPPTSAPEPKKRDKPKEKNGDKAA